MVFLSFSDDNQKMKYFSTCMTAQNTIQVPTLSCAHRPHGSVWLNCVKTFTQPGWMLLVGLMSVLVLVSPALQAQTATPSAQEMIEKLKVQPEPELGSATGVPNGPPLRTRGLRNLSVKAAKTPEGEAAAAAAQETAPDAATEPPSRPSLSLMIQFDFNSAKIRPESQPALHNLAMALQSKELAEANFAVEGHTDAKGSNDYNLKLSQSRADAVQKFLASQGVPSARLVTAGKGATELANPKDPLAAENRRVRIVNLQ
jgi:outer membrane protein OmpA-like peptidoglycan-associated protein